MYVMVSFVIVFSSLMWDVCLNSSFISESSTFLSSIILFNNLNFLSSNVFLFPPLCDVFLCDVFLCAVFLCDVFLCAVFLCDVFLCAVFLCDFLKLY